jgi:thiamine pyrophosphate-dependent acetolactate synthase large subunit-like protein
MRLLLMLAGTVLIAGCETAVSNRPCPRVTEFPRDLQMQAAEELVTAPALRTMMDAMAIDRAFNRAVCR